MRNKIADLLIRDFENKSHAYGRNSRNFTCGANFSKSISQGIGSNFWYQHDSLNQFKIFEIEHSPHKKVMYIFKPVIQPKPIFQGRE